MRCQEPVAETHEAQVEKEGEDERHRCAHEVEGVEVNGSADGRAGGASEYAAAGRLRAVGEFAEADDGENGDNEV